MIIQSVTLAAKRAMLPQPGDWRIALYSPEASLDCNIKAYTTKNEVSAVGYHAGGAKLKLVTGEKAQLVYASFEPVTWEFSSIIARGALVYDATHSRSLCVFDFGSDRRSYDGNFTIEFPPCTPEAALIRL